MKEQSMAERSALWGFISVKVNFFFDSTLQCYSAIFQCRASVSFFEELANSIEINLFAF